MYDVQGLYAPLITREGQYDERPGLFKFHPAKFVVTYAYGQSIQSWVRLTIILTQITTSGIIWEYLFEY